MIDVQNLMLDFGYLLTPCLVIGFVAGLFVVLFGEALAGLVHLIERWTK